MNLETMLDSRLWQAIENTYSGRNFTSAILDAIHFMSDIIREKTGLESDGVALVGQAFSGKSPRLQINKLQSETDRNVQSGIEQLLRGIFQAFRNPRSHERISDSQADADAIILFLNHVIGIIDKSRTPFSRSDFLQRVFDQNFVENERYAQLLAQEIPPKKRLEIMFDILREKEGKNGRKLVYFVAALMAQLNDAEKIEVYEAISNELKVTNSAEAFRLILQLFHADLLDHINEAARLRLENKLIGSIAEGRLNLQSGECVAGSLGTWAQGLCSSFILKHELLRCFAAKIASSNPEEYEYFLGFFWRELINLGLPPVEIVLTIRARLKSGNKSFYDKLQKESLFGNQAWAQTFSNEMANFKPAESSKSADEDLPF